MNLRFRHGTVNNQDFLFSLTESQEDYYFVTYDLVRNLLTGMAKRSKPFCSLHKLGFVDYPFTYSERQLDSILLPELSELCKGVVIAEYPITRNSKKFASDNSRGRIDYWCIYKDYSFSIEVKHSYHNMRSNKTKKETTHRWYVMNKYQQDSSRKDLQTFIEHTNGIIRLSLQFVTVESGKEPNDNLLIDYKNKEQSILIRLYEDMKTIAEPDFISSWEIDSKLVKQLPFYGTSYPGLILAAKFYEPILHDGSKRKRS